jgi:hypothetical protein
VYRGLEFAEAIEILKHLDATDSVITKGRRKGSAATLLRSDLPVRIGNGTVVAVTGPTQSATQ